MKTFVSAKIHGIRVTQKSVKYNGSVAVCPELMRLAQIEPFEQVHVINLRNGERWVTYALRASAPGIFSLNGGGALLGEVGDPCVIITYRQIEQFLAADVVFCDENNQLDRKGAYTETGLTWFGEPDDG